jgi:hypothetical protein
MTMPDRPPSFTDRVREAPRFLKIGLPILLVLVVVGAATSGGNKSNESSSVSKPISATPPPPSQKPRPQPVKEKVSPACETARQMLRAERAPGGTPAYAVEAEEMVQEECGTVARARWSGIQHEQHLQQGLREALGDSVSSDDAVGDSEVRSVKVTGQLVEIILSTPEGGFEGASTDDTDALTSAALAKVYGDADWRGAASVEFRGGLVDSATGRPLPNAPTVSYRVNRNAARRIDWSDEEALYNIDWSIYRGLCQPAIKGC